MVWHASRAPQGLFSSADHGSGYLNDTLRARRVHLKKKTAKSVKNTMPCPTVKKNHIPARSLSVHRRLSVG
jgi:hypothetical protein